MPFVTSIEEAGIEKGVEKVAVKMLENGKSDQEVAELTDLSLEEIKRLREQLDSKSKHS